jgi:hypothetical protein
MRPARFIALGVLLTATALTTWGSKEKAFAWPVLPSASTLKKDMGLKSKSGLVALTKLCKINIKSYPTSPPGVRRDEFVRMLVVNEDGVRQASIDLNDDPDAKIESIQARTVAPDGTITKADPDTDIHKTQLKKGQDKVFGELASVNFPRPEIGAILDVHFVTIREGLISALIEPVAYANTTMLDTTFRIDIHGGVLGYGWSVLILGDDGTTSEIKREKGGTVTLHILPFSPNPDEPISVPYYKNHSVLLCYINFADTVARASWNYGVDPEGRISNFRWPKDDTSKFWDDFFKRFKLRNHDFLKHAGRAKKVDVEKLAPPQLPVEERVRRLYDYVQSQVTYNPNARRDDTLSALVKRGYSAPWKATLYLSYLLDRAHITNNPCLVDDRYSLRFSPIIRNPYVYHFGQVVMVEIPQKGRVLLMPGDFSMPYRCLPAAYQGSLAFWADQKGELHSAYTSMNPPGKDRIAYHYDVLLSPDGSLKGKIDLNEAGAPARSFRWWQKKRDYRRDHPSKKDKTSALEKKKKVQERLKSEMSLPGTKLVMSDFSAGKVPQSSSASSEVSCKVQGESFASPMQDKWLVYVDPLMVGFTNPFTAVDRQTPIWYRRGGHVTLDGLVRLPKGSTIVDVPNPVSVQGPDHTRITFSVRAVEKDGTPAIQTRLEYDQPYIIGSNRYQAWKIYEDELAKLAGSRCVVTLPAQGELE